MTADWSTSTPRPSVLADVEEARTRSAPLAADAARARRARRRHGRRHDHRGRRQRRHDPTRWPPRSPRAPTASGCSAPSSCSWIATPCPTRTSRRPPTARRRGARTAARCCCAPSTPAPTSRSPTSASRPSRTRSSGVRGVRLGLARPDLLLAAAARGRCGWRPSFPVRVMFPMVATADELDRALEAAGASARRAVGLGTRRSRPASWWRCPPRRSPRRALAPSRRLLLDRHERPDAVHARRRSRQRTRRGAVRRGASGRAAPHRGHDRSPRGRMVVGSASAASSRAMPAATSLLLGLGVRELSMSAPAIAAGQAGRARHRHRPRPRPSPRRRWHARPRPRSGRCSAG